MYLGEYDKAIQYHSDALSLFREVGNLREVCNALGNLGLDYIKSKQNQQAKNVLDEALTLSRKIGDLRNEAYVLRSISKISYATGDISRAISIAKTSLGLLEKIDDSRIPILKEEINKWETELGNS